MVYEEKCEECGKVLDFGGRKRNDKLPEDAIKFDGSLYCRECVRELINFGSGDIFERIDNLEDKIEDIGYEMGMKFGSGD